MWVVNVQDSRDSWDDVDFGELEYYMSHTWNELQFHLYLLPRTTLAGPTKSWRRFHLHWMVEQITDSTTARCFYIFFFTCKLFFFIFLKKKRSSTYIKNKLTTYNVKHERRSIVRGLDWAELFRILVQNILFFFIHIQSHLCIRLSSLCSWDKT